MVSQVKRHIQAQNHLSKLQRIMSKRLSIRAQDSGIAPNQPSIQSVLDNLGEIVEVKFFHNVRSVRFGGSDGNSKLSRYLFVSFSQRDQTHYFQLSGSQSV